MGVSYPYTNYPRVFDHWDEIWIQEGSKVKWRLSQLKSPSEKLYRMETLAFWRLLRRAAHRRPNDLRSEEAICLEIREHRKGSKKSCDNQCCSDQCDLRSFLRWPKDIPLHDPQSFKELGMAHKEIRETFVDAVYELEFEDVSAGPSPSVSSIWSLGKLVELEHSASAGLHVEVPPRTVSWRVHARSGTDTSSSVSCGRKMGPESKPPDSFPLLVSTIRTCSPLLVSTIRRCSPMLAALARRLYMVHRVTRHSRRCISWAASTAWSASARWSDAGRPGTSGRCSRRCRRSACSRLRRCLTGWCMCSGAGIARGKIYAVGGSDGLSVFADVEMYDPAVDKWLSAPSMLDGRFNLAAAEMHNSLYAVGGFNGQQYLSTMERFDPREGYWVRAPSMSTKRGSLSAAVYNNTLFALGDFDGNVYLNTVESYEPRMN